MPRDCSGKVLIVVEGDEEEQDGVSISTVVCTVFILCIFMLNYCTFTVNYLYGVLLTFSQDPKNGPSFPSEAGCASLYLYVR